MNLRHSLFAAGFFFALPFGAQAQDTTAGTYNVRLQDIRSRVEEIQTRTHDVHIQLMTMAKDAMAPGLARLDVDVANQTTSAFKLFSARVWLDGSVQYERHEGLADEKNLPVFTGAVSPGDHNVRVEIVLQGNGYGVFTYLRGYKITLTSNHAFTVDASKPSHVTATAYELMDVTVPLERRPQISWQMR